jgi:hypothetical protein
VINFVCRAFSDGTDFIGTDKFRPAGRDATRVGFGDMISEISNAYAQTKKANIRVTSGVFKNAAYDEFMSLVDMDGREYNWHYNPAHFCNSNEDLERTTGSKLLMCYPDYPYIRLVKERFRSVSNLPEKYVTYQSKPLAQKCEYHRPHVEQAYKRIRESYGVECFDIHNLHNQYSTAQIAYIIDNAIAHVGVDSGMTHFALCIKEKQDVHIVVPEDRITGVSRRWIDQGYKVELV